MYFLFRNSGEWLQHNNAFSKGSHLNPFSKGSHLNPFSKGSYHQWRKAPRFIYGDISHTLFSREYSGISLKTMKILKNEKI